MSHTYRLTIEYDGSEFSGWQIQPIGRTVEGVFREALAAIVGERPLLTAAGRTDAGAHAHGQVVGFAVEREWPVDRLVDALNARLPEDVVAVAASPAPAGFHARFDAQRRTYRYMVMSQRRRPAIARKYAWYVGDNLDVDVMRRSALLLRGTHDFAAFGRSPRSGGSTVRTVHVISIDRAARLGHLAGPWAGRDLEETAGSEGIAVGITVTANAFLYGMMRSIAGALVAVGAGRISIADIEGLLSEPHQARRQTLAPAHGLHQWSVTYPAATTAYVGDLVADDRPDRLGTARNR